jgi:hypothetical protein
MADWTRIFTATAPRSASNPLLFYELGQDEDAFLKMYRLWAALKESRP